MGLLGEVYLHLATTMVLRMRLIKILESEIKNKLSGFNTKSIKIMMIAVFI